MVGPMQGLYMTEYTVLFKSTVGPVLTSSLGDTDDTTISEKAPPPSVHLLHATNNILRPHCVKFFVSSVSPRLLASTGFLGPMRTCYCVSRSRLVLSHKALRESRVPLKALSVSKC